MLADLLWLPIFLGLAYAPFIFDRASDAPPAPPPAELIGCDFD